MKPGAFPWVLKPDLPNLMSSDLGAKHHIGNPIHIYPLFENGFRAHRKQSVLDNHKESASVRYSGIWQDRS
jgi:hypothetical protein